MFKLLIITSADNVCTNIPADQEHASERFRVDNSADAHVAHALPSARARAHTHTLLVDP